MYPDARALHTTIFRALRAALSLTEAEASQHLIRAYADIPSPEPEPSRNLCYYYLQTDPAVVPLQERAVQSSSARAFSFIPC